MLRALRALGLAGCACLLGAAACTSLLGIDGRYAAPAAPVGDANDAGGAGGKGGSRSTADAAPLDSVGEASTPASDLDGQAFLDARGGDAPVPSAGRDGAAADGCADCPPPVLTACTPGYYEGPVSGTHASSYTIVGVPLQITGVISFRLGEPVNGVATVEDGAVAGTAAPPTPVPFKGTLTGTVTCDTG